jgi:hypothetical protein
LFDPLSAPDELRERATAVVLTAPYHERDARRLGLPVHSPPADTWQDWVEKFGVDPDRVSNVGVGGEGPDPPDPSRSLSATRFQGCGCQFGALSAHQDGQPRLPEFNRKLS